MAGKFGWFLAVSLAWTASGGARAQVAQAVVGQEPLAGDTPPMSTPATAPAATSGTPAVSLTELTSQPRMYVRTDYLLWWMHRGPLPEQPLVTTGPQLNNNAGIFGAPGTQSLFGGNGLPWNASSSARVTAGFNFTAAGTWGIEGSGFLLPRQTSTFNASSTGTSLITRPVFDNFNHVEAVYDIASTIPGTNTPRVSGSVDILATTEFWGYEVNIVHHPLANNSANVDMYFGFRSLGLDERFEMRSDIKPELPGVVTFRGVPVNNLTDHVTTADLFSASNRFYGPQIGGGFNWQWGRLGANLIGKVAAGVNHQRVTIIGSSSHLQNGAEIDTAPGGILAQPTNSGVFTRDVFCLAPEFDLNFSYDITSWMRARLGYNLIYWSSVVRPGSQIDRNIDISQVPSDQAFGTPPGFNAARPSFSFKDTDFWAHGLNFGVEVRY